MRKLLDELITYLNNLRAGDVLLFIIVISWGGYAVISKLLKIKKLHAEQVTNELHKQEEYQKLVENLAAAQDELGALKKQTNVEFDKMKEEMEEHIDDASDGNIAVSKAIENLNKITDEHEKRVTSLEKTISQMREQIDLLFKSDKEYFRAYIVEGYNKYVKQEHAISLMTLQGFESMYNKYLSENDNRDDEFLARIMRELRNLPTTHDH